jgi:hypothetical protein
MAAADGIREGEETRLFVARMKRSEIRGSSADFVSERIDLSRIARSLSSGAHSRDPLAPSGNGSSRHRCRGRACRGLFVLARRALSGYFWKQNAQ